MKILLDENSAIENAHKKYLAFTKDEELVDAYEAHMKWKRDYKTGIAFARKEGEKKGRDASQLSIAKTMIKKGLECDLISEITGISIDELKKTGFTD